MKRILLNFLLWLAVSLFLCGLFFIIDYNDGAKHVWYTPPSYTFRHEEALAWAPMASVIVAIIGFYWASIDAAYRHMKRSGRNVVRWMSAFILFTPVLAGIAYLLTWPKGQKPKR